ncbi:MAG: glucarate dehydratase, partial [Chloroflexota bacterium]|nr:glucarate dehydratase [Chloroflexota bacterium]
MKISAITATPIAFADPPLLNFAGLHQPYALRTIVEVETDEGISGFGEVAGGEQMQEAFRLAVPDLIGLDAFNRQAIRHLILGGEGSDDTHQIMPGVADQRRRELVYSGIEVALLDIAGKALGLPVHALLGGKVRDTVDFSAYLFYKHEGGGGGGDDIRDDLYGPALDPDGIVRQARAFIDEYGFRSVKLKGGAFPPEQEMDAMRALHGAFGGGVPLRIDPNGAWTVETSVKVGVELDGILEYLEDPAPGMDNMAAVRGELITKGVMTPLATNMIVTRFERIAEAYDKDACQIILSDHHIWGGLQATHELGRLCETFSFGLSMHSNSHLGVSLMAMVHVAAATPALSYA